jgi:energy-coupling factor transporter transmembrane protein EcfT
MDKKILKKKLLRVIGIIIIVIIVGYFFFFALFPIMLIGGPPTSLYYIHNFDTENHTLTISILDSTNKTILYQSYNVQPDMHISYNRGFGWYPTVTWTPFTWAEGKYTFYAVLDGNITASHTTNVQITQTIAIDIGFEDIPLEIGEMWV